MIAASTPLLVTHHLPPIADTWPQALNDSAARRDWNWTHYYDLKRLCQVMFVKLAQLKQTSQHVTGEVLNRAIRDEQMEQLKVESTNDQRQIQMATM